MKILYISSTSSGMRNSSIYFDLMQKFVEKNHEVYCVYAQEKREGIDTIVFTENDITYLGVKTGNITKNKNLLKKGLATLRIDGQFKHAINEQFGSVDFDLVLYSTPPITFVKTLKYFKKKSVPIYLMLKDIFPQNAVDLQMFPKNGLIHRFFLKKEKANYHIADYIGVMSPANMDFVLKDYPEVEEKMIVLPNAISLRKQHNVTKTRKELGLPEDDVIFLYGGNIGKPQSPEFIIECVKEMELIKNGKFIICGWGSDTYKVTDYIESHGIKNTLYLGQKDVDTYNAITALSDVGLIFLDYRFTIPNFPQRLLSYLNEEMPVICATDCSTDIGRIASENSFGISVPSNDSKLWSEAVKNLIENKKTRQTMGENGYHYLKENYNVECAYSLIMNHINSR